MNWLKRFGDKPIEHKQGQMERHIAELYKTIVSSSSACIYITQNKRFQFANPQFQKYTGFSQDELLGMDPLMLIYPEDRGMTRENAIKMLKGELSIAYEFRIITRRRQIRWIMETVTSIQHNGKRAVLGACIDITELKEAKKRLEELEALDSSILDAIPVSFLVLRNRRIIFASDDVEAAFGWKPEELIGKTTQMLYQTKEEYEEAMKRTSSVLEQRTIFIEELPCRRKDGREITCLVKSSRIGGNSKGNKVLATFEDISERKKMDEEAQEQRHELNRRIKELNCLYTISNLIKEQDISIEEISKSIISIIPLSFKYPEATCARLIVEGQEFKTGNYEETIQKQVRDIIVGGKQIGTLEVGCLREGPENSPEPFLGEEINLINTLAAQLREIISYRRTQELLRSSETNLHHIISRNADGMTVVDSNGILTFINPAAEALFGRKAEQLLGKSFGYPVVAGEKTEVDIVRKGGEVVAAEMRTVEIEWDGYSACLASLRDITKRKQIEQKKTDFVSIVSYQLKNPVAEIKGYIGKMLMGLAGDLTAKQKQYLEEMQEISSRSYRIISGLLDVSRIERGVISVDIQPVKLEELVDLALKEYAEKMEEKGLVLNLEGMDSEIIVLADKDKMIEVLSNVIDNTVKSTDEGLITMKMKKESGFGIVEVADSGKGIFQDLPDKLLNTKQNVDGVLPSENNLGVGLYIAKNFMELQHGDISASSINGKGSSVILKIPLAQYEVPLAKR